MLQKKDLYKKMKDVFPDIGEIDKDVQVEFDSLNHAWVVDLKNGKKHLKTYVEEADAESCVNKNVCIGVGIQIGQLRDNLKIM